MTTVTTCGLIQGDDAYYLTSTVQTLNQPTKIVDGEILTMSGESTESQLKLIVLMAKLHITTFNTRGEEIIIRHEDTPNRNSIWSWSRTRKALNPHLLMGTSMKLPGTTIITLTTVRH
ncbi:hypothetical protein O9993_15820 [Vibrio lentus]|nr:hypothetical protein [Vibrio lentus]